MASVNPGINPTNDPDYTRSSRGADVLDSLKPQGQQNNTILPEGIKQGNRAAEYAGSAAGAGLQAKGAGDQAAAASALSSSYSEKGMADLFGSIVQGADYLVKTGESLIKHDIDRKVYDTVNAEREKEITRLQEVQRGVLKDDGSNPAAPSLLDANASADIPEEVKEAVAGEVKTLAGLKAAGGRLSKDYYYGKQTDAAKELRTQYPGYKEYVDEQFKKVLGTDPANAKITQMINDINRASQAVNSERNQVIKALVGSEMPGADGMLAQYLSGKRDASSVWLNLAQHNSNQGIMKQHMLELQDANLSMDVRQRRAQNAFDFNINTSVNAAIKGLTINLGADTKVGLEEFTSKLSQWDPRQIQAANAQVGELIERLKYRWTADTATPLKDDKGNLIANSWTDAMGGTKVRDEKISQALGYLTAFQKGLQDRDVGPAYRLTRQLDAQLQQTRANLRALPGVGTAIDMSKVLTEAGLDPKMFTLEMLDKNTIDTELRPYRDNAIMAMKSQLSIKNTGKPTTAVGILNNMQENNIKDPGIVDSIIKEAVASLTPDMPEEIKKNVGAAMFSPENRGFISRLAKDGKDSQGNDVPGQWYAYSMLTNDKVADAMFKLGGNHWINYKNWAEVEFKGLFTQHIKDLNSQTYGKGIQVMWDSTNKEFDVFSTTPARTPEGARLAGGQSASSGAFQEAKATINRINAGLASLKTIGTYTGKGDDVDAYLLRTLTSSGWTAAERTKGLPKAMADAIIKAREEDEVGKAQKGVVGDSFNRINQ